MLELLILLININVDLDRYSLDSKLFSGCQNISKIVYFYVTNTWGRVGLGFRKKMSLNLMSLNGWVG